jgi:asparagine synthase (glutamine-hydrolysing)
VCGIVAIYSMTSRPIMADALGRATAAIAHRGPDGRGSWQSVDGRIALGHSRLAIVDFDAAQPLASEEDRFRLVANGEFYDYARIQAELRKRGHRLRTRSDSEVALHLYEERGAASLDLLRGEFAFVIWDEREQRLFAARDRFGIKPLFYAEHEGVLYLASEAKAILAAGVPATWDDWSVYQSMHLAFDTSRSLFSGIRQVPPAHYLTASPNGIHLDRYWDIPYPRRNAQSEPITPSVVEQVRELLDESVRMRMQADVPVGFLLSGGIDSSTLVALGARQAQRPVTAFTIGFADDAYDESKAAESTAREVGAEICVVRLTDEDTVATFAEGVQQGEMVQFNAHGSARFLLSREIRRAGYKAVMAGEGADELFGGYAFIRAALAARGSGRLRPPAWLAMGLRLVRPPSKAERDLATVSPWLSRIGRAIGGADPAITTLVDRLRFVRTALAPDFVERFRKDDPYRRLYESLDQRDRLRSFEPAKALLYVWLRTIFVNYHLAADRLDMAHAVEVRLPYLDHVLFEYVSRIPAAELARGGQNKFLLREAARPLVPAAVYQRAKKPFLAPPAAATPGTLVHDFVQDTLRGPTPPFLDRGGVIGILDGVASCPPTQLVALEALLMALVSLTLLDEHYFAGARPLEASALHAIPVVTSSALP